MVYADIAMMVEDDMREPAQKNHEIDCHGGGRIPPKIGSLFYWGIAIEGD